ncbi:hypothetical protein PINS_up010711 [Pythium insidiosum]|nr:hypothetical protein PINS_up010711 [Pythium insidiosum]
MRRRPSLAPSDTTATASEHESEAAFSWRRCLLSLVAYALLLSDTLRGGVAVRTFDGFSRLEPDALLLGPYAYEAATLRAPGTNSSDSDNEDPWLRTWLYKYDTTSITMRAVAQHLALDAAVWPPCVRYETKGNSTCDHGVGLRHSTVFRMLDALVDAVARERRRELSLRSEHVFVDRLRDRLLPTALRRRRQRSSHALYLSAERLQQAPICGVGVGVGRGRSLARPHGCVATWQRLRRFCASASAFCDGVVQHDVWTDVEARLQRLLAQQPQAQDHDHAPDAMAVDLLVLEGADELSPGGVLSHGTQHVDVVAIARVRHRATNATRALHDVRYEGVVLVSNAVDAARVVAALRLAGQSYVWLRLALLVAAAVASTPSWRAAARVLLTAIPSQVVVYGAWPPVLCYAAAHALDASVEYALVAHILASPLGVVVSLRVADALRAGAVSLRCVWTLALLSHVGVALSTTARHARWSPPRHGVRGVPGFFLALLAAPTVLAQLRVAAWRDSRVERVAPVPTSARRFALRQREPRARERQSPHAARARGGRSTCSCSRRRSASSRSRGS